MYIFSLKVGASVSDCHFRSHEFPACNTPYSFKNRFGVEINRGQQWRKFCVPVIDRKDSP